MLATLEADRGRVADIEAHILDLELSRPFGFRRSLFTLRTEKSVVRQRLDAYKYPVLTLPNEIISEIFLHCLPIYPLRPPLAGIRSPTFLTYICSRWREIALSIPALWRAISLSCRPFIPFAQKVQIFDMWLSRSGDCPLSIDISEDHARMYASRVLSAAAHHRTRWEHLTLDISPTLLPTIEGPMPLLRHLALTLDYYAASAKAMNAVAFRELPLLRTVVLDSVAASHVILPWVQLTSLTLNRIYPDECTPLLKQTTNLVNCTLGLYFSPKRFYDHGGQPADVELRYLESLVLNDLRPHPRIPYLATFIVPALRRLQIAEALLGPDPIASLAAFILRSGCALQELHITNPSPRSQNTYQRAFASIRTLSFSCS
ncbi:hypothetical protein B0H13DRAFT_940370 [Mycena leptocephala]|nr:hypothetical protein B0H13DRAFT_398216 [Mycena leptocephala]KAJ7929206.1 hypothetical protein B0H13DRAFT_940370 [Mycena leptocephala]